MANNTLGSSSPCKDCHRKLLSLGIKRIIYTGENNSIHKQKIHECIPYGASTGTRYIQNDFKYNSQGSKTKKLRRYKNPNIESDTDTDTDTQTECETQTESETESE